MITFLYFPLSFEDHLPVKTIYTTLSDGKNPPDIALTSSFYSMNEDTEADWDQLDYAIIVSWVTFAANACCYGRCSKYSQSKYEGNRVVKVVVCDRKRNTMLVNKARTGSIKLKDCSPPGTCPKLRSVLQTQRRQSCAAP